MGEYEQVLQAVSEDCPRWSAKVTDLVRSTWHDSFTRAALLVPVCGCLVFMHVESDRRGCLGPVQILEIDFIVDVRILSSEEMFDVML